MNRVWSFTITLIILTAFIININQRWGKKNGILLIIHKSFLIQFFYLCLDGFSLLGQLLFYRKVKNFHFFPIRLQNGIDVYFFICNILGNVRLQDLAIIHFIHHFDRCRLDLIRKFFQISFRFQFKVFMLLQPLCLWWLMIVQIDVFFWKFQNRLNPLIYIKRNYTCLSWSNWETLNP